MVGILEKFHMTIVVPILGHLNDESLTYVISENLTLMEVSLHRNWP